MTAAEAVSVPRHALKLLWRYFPALVTVICAALAARAAVLWLATWLSAYSSLAATLLFPFAPLAVMTGLIVCLWLMQPSMRFFDGKAQFTRLNRTTLLAIGGLLVPFLAVYASHGLLADDHRAFTHDAIAMEVASSYIEYDFGRSILDSSALVIGLILSVIVLRKIIGVLKLGERAVGVAVAAAYLEILWMATASLAVSTKFAEIKEWLVTRQGIGQLWGAITEGEEWLVAHAGLPGKLLGWVWLNGPSVANFIVLPFAWLTLGAVVYNTSVSAPARQEVEQRAAGWNRYRREILVNAAQPVVGPFRSAWQNFQTMAVAGAIPMLTFCLVFVSASAAELGVVYLFRATLKPLALDVATVAVEPYMLVLGRMVYFLVALPLVVAALDRFLTSTQQEEK